MGETKLVVDVVLVARNCARALVDCLERIPMRLVRSVVVVDNGSTDATAQVARDAGAVVLRQPKGGYGAGCRRALSHLESLPQPPQAVVFVDPTGPEDPAELSLLLEPLEEDNAELVLGVDRDQESSSDTSDRALLGIIGVLYGHSFRNMPSFRAVRFAALVALGLGDNGEAWNVEMQVKAIRLGLHIVEVPVSRRVDSGSRLRDTKKKLGAGRKLYRILRHATAR